MSKSIERGAGRAVCVRLVQEGALVYAADLIGHATVAGLANW